MPKALQHVYPQWETLSPTGEYDPTEEPREVWRGRMRLVHKQRARKLRRRGVPIWNMGHVKAWFVEEDNS